MLADAIMDDIWSRVSELIAVRMGLHFPPERYTDLRRGLGGVAQQLGMADASECAGWLLSTEPTLAQIQALANHLTIGETYFWRDAKVFDALAGHVLPQLIEQRAQKRELSLWSAACCTGEEAYSLAILVQRCLPDWQQWRITVLGTDINEAFLDKAAEAVYGRWSFRNTPAGFRDRYFQPAGRDHYELLPHIRQMVTFERANLADPHFAAARAGRMDLILCRNTLMYFTPPRAQAVVAALRAALADDGWLIVGASESSQSLMQGFVPVDFPGAILYRKRGQIYFRGDVGEAAGGGGAKTSPSSLAAVRAVVPPVRTTTAALPVATTRARDSVSPAQKARALANAGSLNEALVSCDRWIAAEPLDTSARYLRGTILQELGRTAEARRAFKHAIYLQPQLSLAHMALGNLARADRNSREAARHYANALASLRDMGPDTVLQESDGLSAGRLKEIITSYLASETTS